MQEDFGARFKINGCIEEITIKQTNLKSNCCFFSVPLLSRWCALYCTVYYYSEWQSQWEVGNPVTLIPEHHCLPAWALERLGSWVSNRALRLESILMLCISVDQWQEGGEKQRLAFLIDDAWTRGGLIVPWPITNDALCNDGFLVKPPQFVWGRGKQQFSFAAHVGLLRPPSVVTAICQAKTPKSPKRLWRTEVSEQVPMKSEHSEGRLVDRNARAFMVFSHAFSSFCLLRIFFSLTSFHHAVVNDKSPKWFCSDFSARLKKTFFLKT
jgi:hypothetical protein